MTSFKHIVICMFTYFVCIPAFPKLHFFVHYMNLSFLLRSFNYNPITCLNHQKFLKPGGKVLISDYCCSPDEHSEAFKKYVKGRGYNLLSPADYGKVLLDSLIFYSFVFNKHGLVIFLFIFF